MSSVGWDELPKTIAEALVEYRRRLERAFGSRVAKVALFGSRARGEARANSDIDVLVLIDGLTFAEWREAIGLAADIGVERDTWLSATVYSTDRMRYLLEIESPFARSVARDEIVA